MDRDRILDRLRQLQPAAIVAIVNGDEKKIATGKAGQRGRWERATDAVLALRADSVELRDVDGGTLEVIEREKQNTSVAAAVTPEEKALASAERIATLVAKESAAARESVLRETRAAQDAYVELLRIVVSRVSQLESVYSKVLQAQYQAAIAQADAAAKPESENSETDKLVAQLLPVMAAKLGGGGLQ